MWGKPNSKAEYFRRWQIGPWYAAGIVTLIAIGAIVYFLVIAAPPLAAGKNTETDLRPVKAAIFAALGVGMFAWAAVSTRRWKALASRGRYTFVDSVALGQSPMGRAVPVLVTYRVHGVAYKVKRDLPVSIAEAIRAQPDAARVIYDPQNPASAYVLSPNIAALPDV